MGRFARVRGSRLRGKVAQRVLPSASVHHLETRSPALAAEPARKLDTADETPTPLDVVAASRERQPLPERTAESADALKMAHRIVEILSDKQASDILLLDIRGVSLIADYFVICSTGSERQTQALLKDLGEKLHEEFRRKALNDESAGGSGWVLLDYGDVIVHIFAPEQRAYYRLEELWSQATPVLRMQ